MENFDTAQLRRWDQQYLWHPFTPMKAWRQKPDAPVIVRGQDEFLFDSDGQRYIDGVSSLWCNIHGHHVPELDAAVRRQLDQVAHTTLLGLSNVPSILLAKRLIEIAPRGLSKVFYSDNGSTAVEVACKMAYQYWVNRGQPRRSRFIAWQGAYHGDTLGAVSVGGIPAFHAVYQPLCFPVDRVAPPLQPPFASGPRSAGLTWAQGEAGNRQWRANLETLLAGRPGEYAALITEPLVQGAGGMLLHPPGTLRQLRALADRHEVLLICDEVLTGFGRTGEMFACEHEQVTPDLLCLSKGLTAGYMPLGATLATHDIFEAFDADPQEGKTFYHGHTFTGHPLACAVALASLDLFQTRRLLAHGRALQDLLAAGLAPLKSHPHVADVRQLGLIAAVQIVKNRNTGEGYPSAWRIGGELCTRLRRRGLILRPLADTLVLMPPLAIQSENLRTMTNLVVEALDWLPEIVREKENIFGES